MWINASYPQCLYPAFLVKVVRNLASEEVCVAFAFDIQSPQIEAMESQMEKSRLGRLLDPVFLLALGVLLLNDFVGKAAFHNALTGKLSDFTGLYAFAWVGMSLLPSLRKQIPWLVALAFLLWKSPLIEPLLVGWNALGVLPLGRVLDYGDWAAITVLPLAAWRFGRIFGSAQPIKAISFQTKWLPFAHTVVLGIALFAFCATSYKTEFDFKDKYEIPQDPAEVVRRLNQLNADKALQNPSLSLHHTLANEYQQEGNHRIYLHHNLDTQTYCDTIYAQIDDSVFIDEIREYEVPAIDSIYANPDGVFRYYFELAGQAGQDSLSDQCVTVPAILQLKASGKGSVLSLLRMDMQNCNPMPATEKDLKPEDYLRKKFEENVVAFLKKP
jgi:hypothetical protein